LYVKHDVLCAGKVYTVKVFETKQLELKRAVVWYKSDNLSAMVM